MTAYVARRMVCRQHGLGKIQIPQLPYGETRMGVARICRRCLLGRLP